MATPCPSCNKFTALDNGDPEVDLEVEYDGNVLVVSGNVHLTRNCADCGTTMKELYADLEDAVSPKAFEWKRGTVSYTPDLDVLEKALSDGDVNISLDQGAPDVEEGGGGRYAKNMITAVVPYTITLTMTLPDEVEVEGTYSGDVKTANAASDYEECC